MKTKETAKREYHGLVGTPAYRSWQNAKTRCYNKNRIISKWYTGIDMCPEWIESFVAFHRDMGDRPTGTTLERIDNTKGYWPGNCKWATMTEQALNRRVKSTNKTGITGVSQKGQKYIAVFRNKRLGTFGSITEAAIARREAEYNYKTEGLCCDPMLEANHVGIAA